MQNELQSTPIAEYMKGAKSTVFYPGPVGKNSSEFSDEWWKDAETQLWENMESYFKSWTIPLNTGVREWIPPAELLRAVPRGKVTNDKSSTIDNLRKLPQYQKDLLPRVVAQTMFPFWMPTATGSVHSWTHKVASAILLHIQHTQTYRKEMYGQGCG